MIKFEIKRNVSGVEKTFSLTPEEIDSIYNKINKDNTIQYAKNVIANYIENSDWKPYKKLIKDTETLFKIGNEIEDRTMGDNGEIELDIIGEYLDLDSQYDN